MDRLKHTVSSALVGLLLAVPACPAMAKDTTPKPASGTGATAFSCIGHLDEPVTEAFYKHCLAPTGSGPDTQAADDTKQAPKSAVAPNHTRSASLIRSPTSRDDSGVQFISLEPVPFEFDKAVLTEAATHILDTISAYLNNQPGLTRVLVYGHTDSVGTNKYNYTLSDKRIQVISAYLTSHGVAPSLIREAPRGERVPVDEYWTPEGRKRNRRVQVYAVIR